MAFSFANINKNVNNWINKFQHMKKLNKNGQNKLVPDRLSIMLSIIFFALYSLCFSLTTYLPAALNKEITSKNFTISQSLAFAVKEAFVVLMTIMLFIGIFLIWYCGYDFVWIRIFMFFCIYALIITILWVTTYYNKTDHNILAGVIFTILFLFICLTSYIIISARGYNNLSTIAKVLCVALPILGGCTFVSLFISLLIFNNIKEIFPSFEIFLTVIFTLSFITIGII
jgi:hypothetical protein